jgi:hypothetical protein
MTIAAHGGGGDRGELLILNRDFTCDTAIAPRHLANFAAEYAAIGLPVLPLIPGTKRPRFKGGYKSATFDPQWISRHWSAYPDDDIGIRPPLGMSSSGDSDTPMPSMSPRNLVSRSPAEGAGAADDATGAVSVADVGGPQPAPHNFNPSSSTSPPFTRSTPSVARR